MNDINCIRLEPGYYNVYIKCGDMGLELFIGRIRKRQCSWQWLRNDGTATERRTLAELKKYIMEKANV
jgi:hypothetical protein